MLSVEEALATVLEHARPPCVAKHPLSDAAGLTLAEDIGADIDLPPFDKALMDGYAVRSEDLPAPGIALRIGEEIPAGRTPTRPLASGEAAVIMTGAPLPEGSDAVIQHERTTQLDDGQVRFEVAARPGMNMLPRGREMRAGECVLPRGTIVTPARVGLLASVGQNAVSVKSAPQVVAVPTGDELVAPDQVPGPGQIRNSHAVMLGALARALGCPAHVTPIVRDEPDALREVLGRSLEEADVLLVTGGVSAGQRDLVPETLASLGVSTIFHKIRLKPGKPLLFGRGPSRGGSERPPCLVFGMPGNPVSGLVGFHLFVAPAIRAMLGRPAPTLDALCLDGVLSSAYEHRGDRPTFHPAMTRKSGNRLEIEPLTWAGSADLRTAASSDGFAYFPAGDHTYAPGAVVRFLPMIA